jgi:hypothetical protein
MMKRLIAVVLLLMALPLNAAAADSSLTHYTLLDHSGRTFPEKLVLLPPQVTVKEISAGGMVDPVPEWTRQARANITEELHRQLAARKDMILVDTPQFTPDEEVQVEQYGASYMDIGITAYAMTNYGGSEWAHKRTHFDYTLGEGLAFLREKTGADAAIMVIGEDYVSSQGRKATMILGALVGVGIGGGQSLLSIGVVDLNNGDILWMHHDQSGVKDLKDRAAVSEMLQTILAGYPGRSRKPASN